MRKAIQSLRKPSSSKPLPDGALERASQYREVVTGYFPTGTPIEVQVRNHQGHAALDFKGIRELVCGFAGVVIAPCSVSARPRGCSDVAGE
jgi:hypothetical protein